VDGRLFKPQAVDHLAEQINFFLDNPDEAVKYGQAGRKKVVKYYSWPIVVQDIIKLYHQDYL